MNPSERLNMIKRIGSTLSNQNWVDIELTLEQFGLKSVRRWDEAEPYEYAVRNLEAGSNQQLIELHDYLGRNFSDASHPSDDLPWTANDLRLFISHSSKDKKLIASVKNNLRSYGVDGFVAHVDIEPTKEWANQIEFALRTCDALVCFLTESSQLLY